ncbi:aldehyde dehydrogenase family protein [Sphingobacterium sp. HMA12]|uniref:aldehyde dehydrogenase family protein n=1 Tax=Sphingobacterium sp. HMA12 TaxID=2050894 RepID=UPI000CEA6E0B|nr:aldehyde dehydrogenase family protein [Sphingobacterium sp. HMA12]
MKKINRFLINGEIVLPHGTESFDLINPTNGQHIGSVVLGDEYDVYLAVEAAKQALKGFSQYGISERIALLRRLKDAVAGKKQELIDVMVLEYAISTP